MILCTNFIVKNGTAQFYERGVEIDGTVYGIRTDSDILRIKRSVLNSKFAESEEDFDMNVEIAKIQHTDITFEHLRQNSCHRYRRRNLIVCRI